MPTDIGEEACGSVADCLHDVEAEEFVDIVLHASNSSVSEQETANRLRWAKDVGLVRTLGERLRAIGVSEGYHRDTKSATVPWTSHQLWLGGSPKAFERDPETERSERSQRSGGSNWQSAKLVLALDVDVPRRHHGLHAQLSPESWFWSLVGRHIHIRRSPRLTFPPITPSFDVSDILPIRRSIYLDTISSFRLRLASVNRPRLALHYLAFGKTISPMRQNILIPKFAIDLCSRYTIEFSKLRLSQTSSCCMPVQAPQFFTNPVHRDEPASPGCDLYLQISRFTSLRLQQASMPVPNSVGASGCPFVLHLSPRTRATAMDKKRRGEPVDEQQHASRTLKRTRKNTYRNNSATAAAAQTQPSHSGASTKARDPSSPPVSSDDNGKCQHPSNDGEALRKDYQDLLQLHSQLRDPSELRNRYSDLVFDVPPHLQPDPLPSNPTPDEIERRCVLDPRVTANSIFIGYEEHLMRARRHVLELRSKYASGRVSDLALVVQADILRFRGAHLERLVQEWRRQYALKDETHVVDTSRYFRNMMTKFNSSSFDENSITSAIRIPFTDNFSLTFPRSRAADAFVNVDMPDCSFDMISSPMDLDPIDASPTSRDPLCPDASDSTSDSSDLTDSDDDSTHTGDGEDSTPDDVFNSDPDDFAEDVYTTLRIASWNINCDLPLTITEPAVVDVIKANSLTFFQETSLTLDQHRSLVLPAGFDVISYPRPVIASETSHWGGVALVYPSHLKFKLREDLSVADIIVLELDDIFVINAYISPSNSKWWKWSDRNPEENLEQILAVCSSEYGGGKAIVLTGDLNGRTGNWQLEAVADRYPRLSRDSVINTRGRWIQEAVCSCHDLAVVNGTSMEMQSPGNFTSFQAHGSPTVIDYALVSEDIATYVTSLQLSRPNHTFDHALLQMVIEIPDTCHDATDADVTDNTPVFSLADCLPEPATDVDIMNEVTLAATLSDEQATVEFYGHASQNGDPVFVHIASHHLPEGRYRVAIAYSDKRVDVLVVTGPRPNAIYTAIVYLCMHIQPWRTLVFHIDVPSIIQSLCHDVGPRYLRGALDEPTSQAAAANALRKRSAPSSFVLVDDRIRALKPWKAAALATNDSNNVPATHFSIPDDFLSHIEDTHSALPPAHESTHPKVYTTLPRKPRIVYRDRTAKEILKDTPRSLPPTDCDHPIESHRGRAKNRLIKHWNLQALELVKSPGELWRLKRWWTDPKPRALRLGIGAFRKDFQNRMNPPSVLPSTFDSNRFNEDRERALAMPERTIDISPNLSFSRPFTTEEVIWAKRQIKDRPAKSARGIDGVSYQDLLRISSEKLRELFNTCVERLQVPNLWTISTLIAIPKPHKSLDDPRGYRLISLNSCVAKVMTLLMDRRLREFINSIQLLPDSQNGFREGFRTVNNAFVLRHCIDKARAQGKCLVALSIDITNAFPSTNLSTLWTKLHDVGARGPIIDWLRAFYKIMSYRVRVGDDYSEAFESAWGIMTGDSISPALFLAFTYDFEPPLLDGDIKLDDIHITKLAFADDVIFLTLTERSNPSLSNMQHRFTWAEIDYCGARVFFEISAPKSTCCLIGANAPPDHPITTSDGIHTVQIVEEFRYTGIHLCNDIADPFRPHYKAWSAKARAATYGVFSTETFVGTIPVPTGVKLYYALVDPYFIFGCEVVIDVSGKHLRLYQSVQRYHLRRLLGLNSRSPTAPLHVLTGIPPIEHRLIILDLRFAIYALLQPANYYVNRAYRDALVMHRSKKRSWITDLQKAMKRLPRYPVLLEPEDMESTEGIERLIQLVQESCAHYLFDELKSSRTPLLNPKFLPISDNSYQSVLALRKFLRTVKIPAHRKALTRLLCADHSLAVEQLRRRRYPNGSLIPAECRPCRYCGAETETEIHALFRCAGPEGDLLLQRRELFLNQVIIAEGIIGPRLVNRCRSVSDDDPITAIHYFLEHDDLAPAFAKYVYDVLALFPVSL
ncbi:hypothetical protein NMY22_g2280 [Coprinellus aureogranulatus]|nr:hypothetical protein NMY22_g2280 [Coprinellus aureogranulatus]